MRVHTWCPSFVPKPRTTPTYLAHGIRPRSIFSCHVHFTKKKNPLGMRKRIHDADKIHTTTHHNTPVNALTAAIAHLAARIRDIRNSTALPRPLR